MAFSGSSLCFAPLPIFSGKDYNHWQQKMETFFVSQDLWDMVQNGITSTDHSQQQQKEATRKDAQALYYIQQAVAPTIFPKIIPAKSAKTAWDILDQEYNNRARFLVDMDFDAVEIAEESGAPWAACRILEIPHHIRNINPAAYTPHLISIGPLHHGRPELADMEKRKVSYAKVFLDRTQKPKELFVHFIKEHEESIRGCYPKRSELSSREYVEMILLDSLFIFELLVRCCDGTSFEYADDSQPHREWFKISIKLDLLFFENQLPYYLLSELYQRASYECDNRPFAVCCSQRFLMFGQKDIEFAEIIYKDSLHFTGLVRVFKCRGTPRTEYCQLGPLLNFGAKKLSESKVTFFGVPDGSLSTDIRLRKRELNLPKFVADTMTEKIYSNLVGLEQCQFRKTSYMCSYILLLQMLIQTSDDLAVLIEEGVVLNFLDSDQAILDMLNRLCKSVKADFFRYDFAYSHVCEELNKYCFSWSGWWNYWKKILSNVYFGNIWTGTATIAATILLLLTMTQAITSILQVTQGKK